MALISCMAVKAKAYVIGLDHQSKKCEYFHGRSISKVRLKVIKSKHKSRVRVGKAKVNITEVWVKVLGFAESNFHRVAIGTESRNHA